MATTVLSLCVLVGCLVTRASALCDFPEALQTTGTEQTNYWRFDVSPTEGAEEQVTFDGHTSLAQGYHWWQKTSTENATCIAWNASTDIYLIAFERDKSVTFRCVQFIRRTDNVFVSSVSDEANATEFISCDAGTLHQYHAWVIVSKNPRGKTSQTPIRPIITGSFDFFGVHSGAERAICETNPLPSLFSASCMPGDGITLTFSDKSCVPDQTAWKIGDNTLVYTDTWEAGDFRYALVGDEYFDPHYVLRVPVERGSNFNMTMYYSLVAPPGELNGSVDYVTFHMTALSAVSPCTDNRPVCITDLCDARLYDRVCRRTCDSCVDTTIDSRCSFPKKMRGSWTQYSDDNIATVTINDDVISVPSFGNFTCVDEYLNGPYFVTRTDFTDGCQSQYTCIEIAQQSDAVLKYRIDNNTLWNEPRPCGLHGYFTLERVTLSTGSTCNGNLSDVTSGPNMLEMTLQCDTGSELFVYHCRDRFGASPVGLTAMLSLSDRGDNHTPDVRCWIFTDSSRDEIAFYVMASAQCNDGSVSDITSGRRTPLVRGTAVRVSSEPSPTSPDVHPTGTMSTKEDATDDVTYPAANTSTPEVTTHPALHITTSGTIGRNGTVAPHSEDSGEGAGHVVGIVFGSLLGAVLVACVAFLGWRFYRARRQPYSILWQSSRRESLEI